MVGAQHSTLGVTRSVTIHILREAQMGLVSRHIKPPQVKNNTINTSNIKSCYTIRDDRR